MIKRLLITAILIFALVVAEIAARFTIAVQDAARNRALQALLDPYLYRGPQRLYTERTLPGEDDYTTGSRYTAYAPADAPHTLWLFGNSSLLSGSTADEDTINSQLQKRLAGYRVVSLAVSGDTLPLEYARLKLAPLKAGDMAIFYSGVTEADGAHWSIARQGKFNLCTALAILTLLCGEQADLVVLPETCPEAFAAESHAAREAQAYARARGVSLYIALQPHLYASPLNGYERQLDAVLSRDEAGKRWALQTCWRTLQGALPWSIDLTHALDADRAAGAADWLDMTHATSRGNEIVARALFDSITTY